MLYDPNFIEKNLSEESHGLIDSLCPFERLSTAEFMYMPVVLEDGEIKSYADFVEKPE